MSNDAIVGFIFGVLSSLVSGVVLFWLQGRRDIQKEIIHQRREDTRVARNWAEEEKKISLRGFDLAGANLSGKNLSGADLEDANLDGALMWQTDLSGANLIRARFNNAKLVGTKLNGAKLILSDFTGAVLREVDFSGTRLRRAKLNKLKEYDNCVWKDAQYDETTEVSSQIMEDIQKQVTHQKKTRAQNNVASNASRRK